MILKSTERTFTKNSSKASLHLKRAFSYSLDIEVSEYFLTPNMSKR